MDLKFPIVVVRAHDWACCREQQPLRDADFRPADAIVAGSLVHEDNIAITLALQVFEGLDVRDTVTIQKTAILERVVVKKVSNGQREIQ